MKKKKVTETECSLDKTDLKDKFVWPKWHT